MTRDGDRVVRATTSPEFADAFDVRERVFVDEQGVAADLEYDEYDDRDARRGTGAGGDGRVDHFVAYAGDRPVGAARLRPADESDVGKVERVAVLRERRGEGWGRRLMAAVHAAARDRGFDRLRLHAQTRVRGFYDALGYETTGRGEFEEAGIPHVAMTGGPADLDADIDADLDADG